MEGNVESLTSLAKNPTKRKNLLYTNINSKTFKLLTVNIFIRIAANGKNSVYCFNTIYLNFFIVCQQQFLAKFVRLKS